MPAILQQGCTILCPHGGTASVVPGNQAATASGSPVLRPTDTFLVAGCPFMVGTKPQPCLSISWQAPSTRITVGGSPVLLATSIGLCESAEHIVQGPAQVSGAQARAEGL